MSPLPGSELQPSLLRWYDREKRMLPWRATRDPYAIWVSEVMLQQTQVATVIPYWHRFLERFPTLTSLAQAPLPDVFAHWRGLGYYSRARNLHRAAQEVVARFGGALPADADALASLPSFGPYTTGAVASIAFDLPVALVDGNVARVLTRLFEVEGDPGDRAREKALWELARRLVPSTRAGDWNQGLMELGATVCRPENPLCLLCPLQPLCRARAHGRTAELPPPKVRKARTALELAVLHVQNDTTHLFGRRSEKGLFGGLWELPTLDTRQHGTTRIRLQRSFSTLLGTGVRLGPQLTQVQRTLTHRDLTLRLFRGTLEGVPCRNAPYEELSYFGADAAENLGMSTAMQHVFKAAL